jgi:aconitate hydratase
MDIDPATEPLGKTADGREVYLADIMPDPAQVEALAEQFVTPDLYTSGREEMLAGTPEWRAIAVEPTSSFGWDAASSYVRRPTYFEDMTAEAPGMAPIEDAVVLANLGDFITTDHISPAGAIAPDSPAARYLADKGVAPADFNTYGSRRGNHEVMARGTFANVKLQNKLAQGRVGGWTRNALTGQIEPIFDAAEAYAAAGVPAVVLAGKMYGSGSSRDWAAKGPALLGVRAVIAQSFERIHRSNLIGMGILPLQFKDGEGADALGLDGTERITIAPVDFAAGLPEPAVVDVRATRADGSTVDFEAVVRVDTPTEGDYMQNGGILQFVLRNLAAAAKAE